MSIETILTDLKREREQLDRAIAALEGSARSAPRKASNRASNGTGRRGGITPEGRRRLSEAMKKRWAERRKKSR